MGRGRRGKPFIVVIDNVIAMKATRSVSFDTSMWNDLELVAAARKSTLSRYLERLVQLGMTKERELEEQKKTETERQLLAQLDKEREALADKGLIEKPKKRGKKNVKDTEV